jgi:hypothetical protein
MFFPFQEVAGGKYTVTPNDGIDHVMFQFEDVPETQKMRPTNLKTYTFIRRCYPAVDKFYRERYCSLYENL